MKVVILLINTGIDLMINSAIPSPQCLKSGAEVHFSTVTALTVKHILLKRGEFIDWGARGCSLITR